MSTAAELSDHELLGELVQTFDRLEDLQAEYRRRNPKWPMIFNFRNLRNLYAEHQRDRAREQPHEEARG